MYEEEEEMWKKEIMLEKLWEEEEENEVEGRKRKLERTEERKWGMGKGWKEKEGKTEQDLGERSYMGKTFRRRPCMGKENGNNGEWGAEMKKWKGMEKII